MDRSNTAVAVNHLLGLVRQGALSIKLQGDVSGGQVILPPIPDPEEIFVWKRLFQEMLGYWRTSRYLSPSTTFLEITIPERSLHSSGRLVGHVNKITNVERKTEAIELPQAWRSILLHIKYFRYPDMDHRVLAEDWYLKAPRNLISFDARRLGEDKYDRRKRLQSSKEARERREHNIKVLRLYGLIKE